MIKSLEFLNYQRKQIKKKIKMNISEEYPKFPENTNMYGYDISLGKNINVNNCDEYSQLEGIYWT